MTSTTGSGWIYHERQSGQLCGQHALNNFVQGPSFTIVQLAEIAHQLDRIESNILTSSTSNSDNIGNIAESGGNTNENSRPSTTGSSNHTDGNGTSTTGSHHVDEAGNFSIEVLKAALLQSYEVNLVHQQSQSVQAYLQTHDITTIQGFICHKNDHWFCIRKLYNRYWNLNSTLEYPSVISHFALATEMEQYATQHGYTIFCILPPQTLPEPPSSLSSIPLMVSEENGGKWHLMSDLLQGTSKKSNTSSTSIGTGTTNTIQVDPWENINGTGRRLDGQYTSTYLPNEPVVASSTFATIEGLTEDEMLQLALQQSMEPSPTPPPPPPTSSITTTSTIVYPVPPEPEENVSLNDVDQDNIVRIQFRLPPPHNHRLVRRFYVTNTIADIYSYIVSIVPSTTRNFECLVGYPPKHMLLTYPNAKVTTIQETDLANTTIQIRYLS